MSKMQSRIKKIGSKIVHACMDVLKCRTNKTLRCRQRLTILNDHLKCRN